METQKKKPENDTTHCLDKLKKRNVKPTANRLLVLKALLEAEVAMSLADLENKLETVDKSGISRSLHLFLEHKLIHAVDDGSGSVKYAVCDDECFDHVMDMHLHFRCTRCEQTYCLPHTPVPAISLPQGFVAQSVNYVVTGFCPKCATKQLV